MRSPSAIGFPGGGSGLGRSISRPLVRQATAAPVQPIAAGAATEEALLWFAVDAREKRLVENEAMFRRTNERIEETAETHGEGDGHVYEFLCECSNADCTLRVRLSLTAYESARRDSAQFVLAPGHELPEIEEVLFRTEDYQLVRKLGEAAEIAGEEDPRT